MVNNLGDKSQRPRALGGLTIKAPTGCGNMYVQLNWKDGRPFEVFATLGRGGGCSMSLSEALTRSMTSGLRFSTPITEYIDQLKGIRCPSPHPFPKEEESWSCPDALARVLKDYGLLSVSQVVEIIMSTNGLVNLDNTSARPKACTPEEEKIELANSIERLEELKRARDSQEL